ncbi:hypothetical protein JG688_00004019 [Phytophthora aleatoria]|uniref:Uncharacterized protein n=1 Tax=Phytophthora aleatoria TaxID=2496075 RepID=A0A8J5J2D3_9STRA|nr:hypothetical protein JG688_00004019 [Phytophthora aleatoria]
MAPTWTSKRQRKQLKEFTAKFTNAWFAIQITHYGGKYSIERMLALEEYTRKVSLSVHHFPLSHLYYAKKIFLFKILQTVGVSIMAFGFEWDLEKVVQLHSFSTKVTPSMCVLYVSSDGHDIIPKQAILTVDFFDAFYLAMCMQTLSSIATVIIIMIVDFVQTD